MMKLLDSCSNQLEVHALYGMFLRELMNLSEHFDSEHD
jgi:hypothetical protein